ncbi:Checkpoint protein hus1 [Rhodotorula sphaerocarpa]
MRFKADLRHPTQFARLIASLSPLGKVATLKLKSDAVHLICMADGTKSGVQVWSQIQNSSLFDAETLRLDSNHHNEIYLEVSLDALSRALKSTHDATRVTIKLAKKGGSGPQGTGEGSYPALSIQIESSSRLGKKLEIVQDVGVRVKKAADIELLKEPLCPAPEATEAPAHGSPASPLQVIITLPDLQQIRTVVERLKTVSPFVTVSANNQGELRLRAEADEANVETEWRGLKRPRGQGDELASQVEDASQFFGVTLDARSLLKFLATYSVASSAIACLCDAHCAIFYVYIGTSKDSVEGGVLTFFVPAVKLDGDQDG